MTKVVIDTNILIGGAWDESSHSRKIIGEVLAGRIEAFATHQTMRENKLLLKRAVKDRSYHDELQEFFSRLQVVRRRKKLDVVSDKEDNKLFESAVAAAAQYLITNDREVLDIENYQGVAVVSPAEFWATYRAETEPDDKPWRDWIKMVFGE